MVFRYAREGNLLIFSRKTGEKIRVGDDIEIVVLEMKKGKVRLGINAPKKLAIHREEIYQKILEENRLAAASAVGQGMELKDFTGQ